MYDTVLDFYIKAMEPEARKQIFWDMQKINGIAIEHMLEKEVGYPRLKSMGLSKEDIEGYLAQYIKEFQNINNIMIGNKRKPIFEEPEDTLKSAQRYKYVNAKRTPEELLEIFGCTWEEYVPEEHIENSLDEK